MRRRICRASAAPCEGAWLKSNKRQEGVLRASTAAALRLRKLDRDHAPGTPSRRLILAGGPLQPSGFWLLASDCWLLTPDSRLLRVRPAELFGCLAELIHVCGQLGQEFADGGEIPGVSETLDLAGGLAQFESSGIGCRALNGMRRQPHTFAIGVLQGFGKRAASCCG